MNICVTGLCFESGDDMQLRTANFHCSPKKFNEFVDVLNDGVRDKIIDMRFGGLLDLKAALLCRQMVLHG
jgi:hypothetical protein